jgi:arylsulfatase A-like enzyme
MLGTVAFSTTAAPARPPNVLLIVADDLGYGDVSGFCKDSPIQTPNIDRLAATGVKFTSFHVNPLCTPTRQCVMTGQYTYDNEEPGGTPKNGVKQDTRFLPQMLQAAGYKTGAFGKWHLGEEEDDHPTARGFDEWIGFHGGSMEYQYDLAKEKSVRSKGGNNTIYNGKARYEKPWQHTTDLFSDEAIRFIGENKDHPFFVYLAFNAVHGPLWTPGKPVFSGRKA